MRKPCILLYAALLVPSFVWSDHDWLSDDIDTQLELLDDSDDSFDPADDPDASTLWPWLNLGVTHKLGLNPASGWAPRQHLTELNLVVDANIGLTGYGQMEINASQYWAGDSHKPADTNYSRLELERAFVQQSLPDCNIKLGLYTIDWGEVEIGGPLNVINPGTSVTDINLRPDSQWLVSTTCYWHNRNLTGFINPRAELIQLEQVALVDESRHEVGLRYNLIGEGGDMAFYLAHLVPNTVLLDLSNVTGRASSYQMVGLSLNRAWSGNLFKFDLAWKHGLRQNHRTGLQRADRLDLALGLELQQYGRQWLVNLMGSHWLNDQSGFLTSASTLQTPLDTARTTSSYLLNISDTWMDDRASWQVTHMANLDGAMHLVSAQLGWDIMDQCQVSLDWLRMSADSNSLYSTLAGYENVALQLTYQY